MSNVLIGSLTRNYSGTEYSAGKTPPLGYLYDDGKGNKYRFLKQTGATAVTASLIAMALTTDKTNYYCSLAAATDALRPFAGVRPVGADSLAQNEYGYFQVWGSATFIHSGGQATAAEEGVISSASVAGKVEGEPTGPFTIAATGSVFAIAEAAVVALDATVKATIKQCLFS